MITCPKCANALPDWSQTCQFCGADTKAVARAKPTATQMASTPYAQPTWIWPAYYIVSGYFVLTGLVEVIRAVLLMNAKSSSAVGESVGALSMVGIIVGGLSIIFGIGLLAKVEFIRAIVNFFCYLQILGGLCGIGTSLLGGLVLGPAALIGVVQSVLNIATAALMIYLIGETD